MSRISHSVSRLRAAAVDRVAFPFVLRHRREGQRAVRSCHSDGIERETADRRDTTPELPSASCSQGASSSRHVIEDGLSSPSTTSEEAPFAVRAATCDDAPFVFRASLPVKSPNWLLRCGDSNRPRVPRGVLRSSVDPFVPASPARTGCVIGSRGDHRRDRTVAIDRISYGTIQTYEFRRWGLSL